MADSAKSAYHDGFIQRVKQAREASGYSQEVMAGLLGMQQGTYKQYESRSLLPHYLFERFCLITRCDIIWLVAGKGRFTQSRPSGPEIESLDLGKTSQKPAKTT